MSGVRGIFGCWLAAVTVFAEGEEAKPKPVPGAAAGEAQRKWQELAPEERARMIEDFRRWKSMSEEDRSLMERRHRRLENMRRQVSESLPEDERRRLQSMNEGEQRKELDRRNEEHVRRMRDFLPEEVRLRLKKEARGLSDDGRREKVQEVFKEEIHRRLPRLLRFLMERGEFSDEEREKFRERFRSAKPQERFKMLRRLMGKHPDRFGLPPNMRDMINEVENPFRAMDLADGLRGPDLSSGRKEHYFRQRLTEAGVSAEELDQLFDAEPSERAERLGALLQTHHIPPPRHVMRRLRGQGASESEIREAMKAPPEEFLEHLRALMDRYPVEEVY